MSAQGDQHATVGTGASDEEITRIRTAILEAKEIDRIIHMRTTDLGAEGFMLGAKISLPATLTMAEVSVVAKLTELRIRDAVPNAAVIYLEPDVWLDPNAPTPTTSAVVTLSID